MKSASEWLLSVAALAKQLNQEAREERVREPAQPNKRAGRNS